MKKYLVKCWIEVDPDNEIALKEKLYHSNLKEAEEELEQAELLQPENKYEIIEIDVKYCSSCNEPFVRVSHTDIRCANCGNHQET